MAQVARKRRQRHEVPCHPTLEEFLNVWIAAAGIGRDKKGPLRATVSQHEQERQTDGQSDDAVRRAAHDQAAGERRRPALLDLLPYLPRDRYHYLLAERWHARTCADPR